MRAEFIWISYCTKKALKHCVVSGTFFSAPWRAVNFVSFPTYASVPLPNSTSFFSYKYDSVLRNGSHRALYQIKTALLFLTLSLLTLTWCLWKTAVNRAATQWVLIDEWTCCRSFNKRICGLGESFVSDTVHVECCETKMNQKIPAWA